MKSLSEILWIYSLEMERIRILWFRFVCILNDCLRWRMIQYLNRTGTNKWVSVSTTFCFINLKLKSEKSEFKHVPPEHESMNVLLWFIILQYPSSSYLCDRIEEKTILEVIVNTIYTESYFLRTNPCKNNNKISKKNKAFRISI